MELAPYQVEGVAHLTQGNRILADDMGLGKTIQSLSAAKEILADNPHYKVLIVTLKSLVTQWRREFQKWVGEDIAIMESGEEVPDARWVITHYEGLFESVKDQQGNRKMVAKKIPKRHVLIVDEAHMCKSRDAKRTKAVRDLARRSEYTWLLTGTPMPNRPAEAWMLLNILDSSFSSFWKWARKYLVVYHNGWALETAGIRQDRSDDWSQMLGEYMLRRERGLLDLPDLTEESMYVEMTKRQKKLYEQIRIKMIGMVTEEKMILAPNPLTQLMRLRQVANDPRLVESRYRSGKTNWLCEYAKTHTEKTLVFTSFAKYAALLHDELKGSAMITGTMGSGERDKELARFQTSEDCNILIGTTGAMSMGLNITEASVVIFADLPWTPDEYRQAYSRVHRWGQEKPVHVIKLLTEFSVDEHLDEILANKDRIISEALAKKMLFHMLKGESDGR